MPGDPRALAAELRRTVSGPMWHGPAISEALTGLTYVAANSRPIPGAHTIWEIVHHIASWADIVKSRLGPTVMRDPVPSRDWPPVVSPSPSTWRLAVERIESSYGELATQVASLAPEDLGRIVPGRDYTVETMVRGVIEHGTYHGGQIIVLRKALARR